jgi:hypothetical protein
MAYLNLYGPTFLVEPIQLQLVVLLPSVPFALLPPAFVTLSSVALVFLPAVAAAFDVAALRTAAPAAFDDVAASRTADGSAAPLPSLIYSLLGFLQISHLV